MKLKPYPSYKDSGVEWLGEVPEHWEVTKLSWVVSESNAGEVIDKSHWGGDQELLYTCAKEPLLSDYQGFPEHKRTNQNDLLLTRNGTPYVHLPEINAIYTNVVQRIRIAKGRREYVKFALLESTKSLIGYGVSIESLNYELWKELRFSIPTESEQSTIVTFLDHSTTKLDTLIGKQEKLIELLQEKRQAVISHAVTKGLDPDVPMKDSGVEWLGEVPAHWDMLRIAVSFKQAADAGQEELPILRVSIHDGVSDREFDEDEGDRITVRSEDRTKYMRVSPGDLVYNMMRAWQGGFGAVKVIGMVSPAYVIARPIKKINTQYVEQYLRIPSVIEHLRGLSRGVTDFRLRLYWEEFKNVKIPVPSVEEQDSIMAYIESENFKIDRLVEKAQQSIELAKEHRTALISAAVTGKIDVRNSAVGETNA